jgi:virulence factor Mce-like protein
MRRIIATAAVLIAVGGFLFIALGTSHGPSNPTYKVELDNAFGLVQGADFKVAGVIAGTIKSISLDQKTLDAVVTVSVNQRGFGAFHSDVFCQSRPQSLIGEYFLDCEPGTSGKTLPPGSTIPVTHTQSTIPADLVQNIMRLPYRQRFSLLINELGAAVAARSEDLQSALKRADPALAETDNLLALLANDAHTIRDLNASADQVITALAKNNQQVQQFVVQANNAATDSATQAPNITATWNKLPGFLEQLRPAMAKLGTAADAQDAVFTNLNEAATNLKTFFHELTPFSQQSTVSLACGEFGNVGCPSNGASLGSASAVGKPAVQAAGPAVRHLNQFAGPTGCDVQRKVILNCLPELSQNLAIVLQALDAHGRTPYGGGPIEPDLRSPGGTGYSGIEGVLQYVFNITNAINYFGPYGHSLGVDVFANNVCSPYATPQTIADNLASYAKGQSLINPRSCYAFLGPNQPGVNEPDPSWRPPGTPANPSGCVPDPGGYPVDPGYGVTYYGPRTNACKLQAQSNPLASHSSAQPSSSPSNSPPSGGGGSSPGVLPNIPSPGGAGGSSSLPKNLNQTVGQILSQVTGGAGSVSLPTTKTSLPSTGTTGSGGPVNTGGTGTTTSQAQQLLNYLMSP